MRRVGILVFSLPVLVVAAIILIPGLRGQEPRSPAKSQGKTFDESRFPLAEFSALDPTDPTERSKRRARSQKYNKSDWGVNPAAMSDSTVRVDFVDPNLSAFPGAQAKAVIIGKITDARAFLSDDKTGIYSAFAVSVDEVVKNQSKVSLTTGTSIEVEREGGRVKFPSGRVHIYMVDQQNMPRVGSRYVLFLTDGNNEPVFQILTGYELREGKVYPLDELPQPKAFENADETDFLNQMRMKISNP